MIRRLVLLSLLLSSCAFAVMGWQSLFPTGSTDGPGENVFPILSPRRIPAVANALPHEANLRAEVRTIVDGAQGPNSSKCVAIRRNGRVIIDKDVETSLVPASTVKIITGAAALHVLGADHRFTTTVVSSGDVDKGSIDGPLYLIGGGDPLLTTDDFVAATNGHRAVHTSLERLADDVVASGVRSVQGGVVGDASLFDDERYSPAWEPAYRTQGQVGPISALAVNQGFTSAGGAAEADVTTAAASRLQQLLNDRGVVFTAPAASGRAPSENNELASIDSRPVSDLVTEMLTESDNTTAEILLKSMGVKRRAQGTSAAGIQAVTDALREMGAPTTGLLLVDGSGLARADRATCGALAAVLTMHGDRSALADGLPRAGQTGTLATRFVHTAAVGRVAAKTGTLAGVSGLAGWARPDAQPPFSFAVISNGLSSTASRTLEERVALLLATVPAPAPTVAYAARGVSPQGGP